MTNAAHLRARRQAQAIEKLARHVRKLRQRGKLTEADAEVRSFQCGNILVVPSGAWRQWRKLDDKIKLLPNLRR